MKTYKEILITGSSGFIGNALCHIFKNHAHIIGTIRSKTETVPWTHIAQNWEEPWTHSNPQKTELFIHAAYQAPGNQPLETAMENNLKMAKNAVNAARKLKSKRVLLLSSGSIYGEHNTVINENTPLEMDLYKNPYAYYLNEIEKIFTTELTSTELLIARLFYPYGPAQSAARLIPRLAKKILNKEPILLRQDNIGEQEHRPKINPMYIDDTVWAIHELVNLQKLPAYPTVVNVGGNEIVSIQELSDKIAAILNISCIFSIDTQNPKAANIYCETKYLNQLTGFKAQISLEEGLKTTLMRLKEENA
ncbi:NAD(P)-dependent oxidoreductase [Candidatus Nomurabacteria bacterium]|nr:NAD(P)-dependent oxidoreductase [Candidatus Nomurabacteria bacterium]